MRWDVVDRWDDEAYSSTRATSETSYPGFFASSAAAIRRTRSMMRLRLAEPPALKARLRCSRVTPNAAAMVSVRTERPPWATRNRQVARCRGPARPSAPGGSRRASVKRAVNVRGSTRSRSTPSSTPSVTRSATSAAAHRAAMPASLGRSGVSAKKGALGNSAASATACQASSLGACTSTTAASTRVSRKVRSSSAAVRVRARRQRRLGKADRASARALSRVAQTAMVTGAA